MQKEYSKNLSNKNLGDYHDLYVESDTSLFGDVFGSLRDMCMN